MILDSTHDVISTNFDQNLIDPNRPEHGWTHDPLAKHLELIIVFKFCYRTYAGLITLTYAGLTALIYAGLTTLTYAGLTTLIVNSSYL